MTIPIDKFTNNVMYILTPEERVELIIQFCNQQKLTGKDYSKELCQVQSEMPNEQRNRYAEISISVILTNRILFELALSLKSNFYQLYSVLLVTLLEFSNQSLSNKKFENRIDFYYQELEQVHQVLLLIFSTEKEIAEKLKLKKVFYSAYYNYFRKIEEEIHTLIDSISNLNPPLIRKQKCRSNSITREMFIKTISEAVNYQLAELK